jgi:porphobilinogen synthase
MNLLERPRRLRENAGVRNMVRETNISKNALVYPLFIQEGKGLVEDIPSLDGQQRCSADKLPFLLEAPVRDGLRAILLFGLPGYKDPEGSAAWDKNGPVQKAIREVKRAFPDLLVISDVCLCEYTSHGHCGLVKDGIIQNDETLPLLARTALSHAEAGASMVAPSDMMDGRVRAIRDALDAGGFVHLPIMSYSAKYASAFYGPFREAAHSAPAFGDRKSYQMDPHNAKEALREIALDTEEGADILMVKPALSYLDVIYRAASQSLLPVAAYSVSGEYAMIKAAVKAGLLDEKRVVCESAISIFRAGARILISYYTRELINYINEGAL